MKGFVLFIAGLMVGAAIQTGVAQTQNPGIVGLNHVGLAVPDIPAAAAFYTEKLGFREAFRNSNPQGQPTAIYMQASRDTFIEVQPANANRKAGLNHYGLHVADLKAYVAELKKRGVMVDEVRERPDDSMVANATDPAGVRIEMFQFGPGSAQGKAIAAWK